MNNSVSTLLECIPDEWGTKFHGPTGGVTRTQTGPNSIRFQAPCHMALIMLTPQPAREVALNSDQKSEFLAPVGTMELIPARADLYARWKVSKENILVALAPEKLSSLAGFEFGNEDFELQPKVAGHVDHRALALANLIRDEFITSGSHNPLYLESLLTVFSTHVLRNYSTLQDQTNATRRGGLTPKALRDVQEYIRANIAEQMSLERLALVVGLSPSHFLRAFRQSTGKAPHQYIIALRLETAEQLAVLTDKPFGEIASLTGFANHSHMTATMVRMKATTPSELRRVNAANKTKV